MDHCILCNSCWLCRGCEVTRLLPYGWHKDYCAARTQLCTSVLSRISGLCNDCIRLVTDIRTVQRAGLTADGLLGIRLVIYIGMLANHENLNDDQLYLIPNVLSASLDRYIGGSLDPTLWLQNPRSMPLHQMVAQHRVQRTMSGDTVIEFILCMKRLLSCHGDLQHSCILCKKLLPTRWMIILCEGCEHTLIGGPQPIRHPNIVPPPQDGRGYTQEAAVGKYKNSIRDGRCDHGRHGPCGYRWYRNWCGCGSRW